MNKAIPTSGIHFVNVTNEGVEIIGENGDKTVIRDTERLTGMAYAIIGVLADRDNKANSDFAIRATEAF